MKVLGISAYYHDSAAALIEDGVIVAAAQEERFTRRRHDPDYPRHAIAYCLAHAGIRGRDLDLVAYYEKPFLKFERLIETYLAVAPRGLRSFAKAMPVWRHWPHAFHRAIAAPFPPMKAPATLRLWKSWRAPGTG